MKVAGTRSEWQQVKATFDTISNKAVIRVDFPAPERTVVKDGLVLLRMATVGGKLIVEY